MNLRRLILGVVAALGLASAASAAPTGTPYPTVQFQFLGTSPELPGYYLLSSFIVSRGAFESGFDITFDPAQEPPPPGLLGLRYALFDSYPVPGARVVFEAKYQDFLDLDRYVGLYNGYVTLKAGPFGSNLDAYISYNTDFTGGIFQTNPVNAPYANFSDEAGLVGSDVCYPTANCAFTGTVTVFVPEPASLALFGAGLLGLGFARRRRGA